MTHHLADSLDAGKVVVDFDQQSCAEEIAASAAIVLVAQEISVAKEEIVEGGSHVIEVEGVRASEFEIQPG